MKRKPWAIIILSLLHILAPVGNLLMNAWRSHRTLADQWMYWTTFLPKHLFLSYVLIPPIAGLLIFLCRRWSYWAYMFCMFLLLALNVYAFTTDAHMGTFLALVGVVVVDIFAVAYFVVPSIQQVYFDPRMRWWEAAPRYRFGAHGKVDGAIALIKNLSIGGLLLETSAPLAQGQKVEVSWDYEGSNYQARGEVAYSVSAGYGIRFADNGVDQKSLKSLIKNLHGKSMLVTERLPGPEEAFGPWLKGLLTRGEGLFPRSPKK
jgi:hypothetical protein